MKTGHWDGDRIIDNTIVTGINSYLTEMQTLLAHPFDLHSNKGQSFTGTKIYGEGFLISPERARQLLEDDLHNSDILFPYMNGEDLNSDPNHEPSRWVINFGERSIDEAAQYEKPFDIARSLVKPYRETVRNGRTREQWWLFERPRLELYNAIGFSKEVMVCSEVTKYLAFCFVPAGVIFAANLDIFPFADYGLFSVMQSSVHEVWARFFSSHLETRLKYSPVNAYVNFPFPSIDDDVGTIGQKYHSARKNLCLGKQEGLTKIYNRFHDPNEKDREVIWLRHFHVEMDQRVAQLYKWTDFDFAHGFFETTQGLRYTISEAVRRDILDRLLALNYQRHAEEEAEQSERPIRLTTRRGRKRQDALDQVLIEL
jgi:hypothetical protein